MATRTKNALPNREARSTRDGLARLRAEMRTVKSKRRRPPEGEPLPAPPVPRADGNLPAEETLDIIVAGQILARRRAAGWSQAELAARAGVRQETVSRIESGKHKPNLATVDKLDRALRAVEV